ncbi:transposase, partial [Halomonas sp. NPDC076908]|uniref:transposase n=1 Tax=Halomonas sp. NPDC076908 TaxID=3390567 RepID=UPI003D0633A6
MGESISPWIPTCNGSIRVELDGQRTTSDSGALLLREALDNSGVIDALEDNLVDRRNPLRIRHSLASQLRTLVLQRAMGWIDLSDTDTLRRDPLWQLACSDARGMTPLAQDRPSQATLSRLLACLGRSDNIDAVHEGLLRLVVWRLTSLEKGKRP